ncbi:Tah11p Ecym_3577 [Eremothecium cymbalariae DBVPG|uniref:DNA replication factor Cdt1 C-terminal domain-containing protein n=1 Tax=Eremothecium cymbalariae (strain CBS 270.75 / DBVPG 7215 / KCTC 17166 / NRRL Y-17582) TaxID=931890 RepID=G8JQR3_ERECY|nr:Hypothetical protein Ecym_3577 [Eremothecium cymbalariae DBVPG\
MVSKAQIIDLNLIQNEQNLYELVRQTLQRYDTFLLKNYANYENLRELVEELGKNVPDTELGFDANFTGVLVGEDCSVEQYIYNSDSRWQFPRYCDNELLNKLHSRLVKLSLYFSRLCLQSVMEGEIDDSILSKGNNCTIIRRYFSRNVSSSVLPGLSFDYADEYKLFQPVGLLSVFPVAKNIQTNVDGKWVTVQEDDCVLIHTGVLMEKLSKGFQTSGPIKILKNSSSIHIEMSPALNFKVESCDSTLGQLLLNQMIKQFPEVAQKFYATELNKIQLEKLVASLKSLYQHANSVLALYKINHPVADYVEAEQLLPQISSMAKWKITETQILRMMYIWHKSFSLVRKEDYSILFSLKDVSISTNKTKMLQFSDRIDSWLRSFLESEPKELTLEIPQFKISDIPILKRPQSSGKSVWRKMGSCNVTSLKGVSKACSTRDSTNSNNLLERIRIKESKASELLSKREFLWEKFLKVKQRQVFDILVTLPAQTPYTSSYLIPLIVDSLRDSNNPVGEREVEQILGNLQTILQDKMTISEVDGGLKVYKWKLLDKNFSLNKIKL